MSDKADRDVYVWMVRRWVSGSRDELLGEWLEVRYPEDTEEFDVTETTIISCGKLEAKPETEP